MIDPNETPEGEEREEQRSEDDGGAPESVGAPEAPSPAESESVTVSSDDWSALEKKAEERDLYRNEYLRARADLDNYQKRVRKERPNWEEQATGRLIRKLLAVVDDFERALEAAREGASAEVLEDGIRLTYQSFLKALAEEGVQEIQPLGERFDPAWHEAVMEEKVTDRPTGEITEVMQKGYRKNETLLRPARVKVARNPES